MNLQIGIGREVTAGFNLKGAEISSKMTIPKPFERSWGDSMDFKELSKFFSESHRMISTSIAVCIMYEVKLDRSIYPRLH